MCVKWKKEKKYGREDEQIEREKNPVMCCVPVHGNSQPYLVFSSSDSFSFLLYLSLRRAVTVLLYENAIPEIFYLLHHLHLLLLRVYGMPTFLSTMFLSRACTKEEDQSVRRPPRRLQVLCPLSLFLFRTSMLFSFFLSQLLANDISRMHVHLQRLSFFFSFQRENFVYAKFCF